MTAKRSAKRSTKKTAARGAKKKPVAKKTAARKAAPKKAARAPAKRSAAKKASSAQRPSASPKPSPKGPNNYPRFVWFDLMAQDVAEGKDFYTALLGWTAKDSPIPGQGGTYTILSANNQDFGGLAPLQDPKQPSNWMPYLLVDNVEKTVQDAEQRGATILMRPTAIPTVGRFAVVRDPMGAVFSPMSFDREPGPPRDPPNLFGPVAWIDMLTDDTEKGLAFYQGLFGWAAVPVNDPVFGKFFVFLHENRPVGGLYPRPPFIPVNAWMPYFEVFNLDSVHQNAVKDGSKVLLPPTGSPAVGTGSVLLDPQGTLFALLQNP